MEGHTLKTQNYENYKAFGIQTIHTTLILGTELISRENTCLAERDKKFN